MSHHKYAQALYGISPTARGVGHVSDIILGLAPPAPAGTTAIAPVHTGEPITKKLVKFVPHAVGLVAGYSLWKKHRYLGALAGHAAINSGYEFYKGDKKKALCELAVEGAGIIGALKYSGGRKPVVGWLLGVVAGSIATYFVEGSPVRNAVARLRG